MGAQLQISTDTLRAVAVMLLDHLESIEGPTVALDQDMFWAIPQEQRFNVYEEPTDLTIGQLSDAVTSLERIREGSAPVTSYALVWLADILRAAGEVVIK